MWCRLCKEPAANLGHHCCPLAAGYSQVVPLSAPLFAGRAQQGVQHAGAAPSPAQEAASRQNAAGSAVAASSSKEDSGGSSSGSEGSGEGSSSSEEEAGSSSEEEEAAPSGAGKAAAKQSAPGGPARVLQSVYLGAGTCKGCTQIACGCSTAVYGLSFIDLNERDVFQVLEIIMLGQLSHEVA